MGRSHITASNQELRSSGIGTVEVPTLRADFEPFEAGLRCTGSWTVQDLRRVEHKLADMAVPPAPRLTIDASQIASLDLAGAWFLEEMLRKLTRSGRQVSFEGLRPQHQALLRLIDVAGTRAVDHLPHLSRFARVGRWAFYSVEQIFDLFAFVGESAVAGFRAIRRPTRIRWRPVLRNIQVAGFGALPIVGLLSFLMGVVIAYQGAAQLKRYGANTFVADLVGLAMLRELSPLLTAIIVAGRSGSAYAAQIGTMKVTEEIDALRTVGVTPVDQLVLPKFIALVVALPLLSVYADALGVAGGMVMAKAELSVGYKDFLDRFQQAIDLPDYLVGIGKAPVFAGIIAVIGCFQGFRASADAESVGRRTTVSVVQSVFLVIVADAVFSVIFSRLGI
jgi:phospholipid/cholesterol/gamma-HCH transport system permease protein